MCIRDSSIPYQVAVQVRNRLFDLGVLPSSSVEACVISVGNISVGGTGKTPFIQFLIDKLKSLPQTRRLKVAVISRGYRGAAKGTVVVSDGKRLLSDPFTAGDEPYMLAEGRSGTVVIVDKNRIRGASAAVVQYAADMILLDDGFQHRRLKRDLDIVLLDGRNPLGGRLLLPAGSLREPVSALARAGLIVLSKVEGEDNILHERCAALSKLFRKPVAATRMVPKYWKRIGKGEFINAEEIRGKRVLAFAGIASPGSFFDEIATLGADLVDEIPLPDHCSYSKFYLDKISRRFVQSKAEWLATTMKDAVKLPPILRLLPVYALQAQLDIVSGGEMLDELLIALARHNS